MNNTTDFLRSSLGVFTLVHDTNSGICNIRLRIQLLRRKMDNISVQTEEQFAGILEDVQRIQSAIDVYYELLKNKYGKSKYNRS
jgi:methyl-accepting chemotaxis protein